jgi:REP element-mobilizing transposase RayT
MAKSLLTGLPVIFLLVGEDFEAKLAIFDGKNDHVHLLVLYPPKVAVSCLVKSLKGVPSGLIAMTNAYSFVNLWGDSRLSLVIKLFRLKPRRSASSHNYASRIENQRTLE